MATKLVFAVLDKAAQIYMQPFYVLTEAVAIRDFQAEANNPESMLCKHAKDFSLYKFGAFDDATGSFLLLREPQFVCAAQMPTPDLSEVPGSTVSEIRKAFREE